MSDLYLVLRNRLATVAEWVYIDSNVLLTARGGKGLSYETMARELHVSSKTWERYEKAGRIPRNLLVRVAEVLDLDIEEPARRRVVVEPEEVRVSAIEDLREHLNIRIDEVLSAVTALDRKLDVLLVDEGRLRDLEQQLGRVSQQLENV